MGRSTRVYVGNLSSRVRESDLEYEFGRYGQIRDITIKGQFGFVEFDRRDDAEYAVRKMDGINLEGSRILVEFAKENAVRAGARGGSGYRLIAEGISARTSWQDLKDWARKAGKVMFTEVYSAKSGGGDKEGIVEYATREDMEEALERLDGTELDNARIKLYKQGSAKDRSRSRDRRSRSRSGSGRRGGGGGGGGKSRSRSRSRSRSGSRRGKGRRDSPSPRRAPADAGSRSPRRRHHDDRD